MAVTITRPTRDEPAASRLVVLLPVFDDWPAVRQLIPEIRAATREYSPIGILIVNDGSWLEPPDDLAGAPGGGLGWVRVLSLRRNLGHQRAIAVGLCYIDEHLPCEAVLVMDADGEDRPEEVPALLARYEQDAGRSVVFAERERRVEGLTFRLFYGLYRLLHRLLTGRGVKVGNFSIVPKDRLASLVVVSELWIHYAAAVIRSRQPWTGVPTERGTRLDGPSKMDCVSLVVHGLSAISVYSDVVFTRLVALTATLAALSLGGLVVVGSVRLFTTLAIPGWASYVGGILLVLVLQAITFVASLTFLVLGARQQAPVIPRRDYHHYVGGLRDFFVGAEPS
jgi:polyisoprenyl-phosphate glycosyltransferase